MRQLSRYYVKPGTLGKQHVRHYNKWLTLRNRVDYDMMPVVQQEAVEAIRDAQTFLEEAEILL